MNSPLKVLMLGWEFPPVINGGLGIACLGMAKAMAKKAELTLLLPKSDPNFLVDGVDIIGLNNQEIKEIRKSISKSVYDQFVSNVERVPVSLDPYYGSEGYSEKQFEEQNSWEKFKETIEAGDLSIFKVGELYDDNVAEKVIQFSKYAAAIALNKDFDVIHAHDWMTFLAGVEIKRLTGKPLAVHVHALQYDRVGVQDKGWIYDLEHYGMQQADMVIPVSHYTGNVCRDHYGVDPQKIFPVHNGAEPVEVYHTEKGFPEHLILFLGRLTHQKGPEAFLEIASKVFEKEKNVRFVMAGTGDKLKPLIEKGAYRQIGDKFHFTGFLTKTKVNDLLAMADVYCMPSVSEPFGLSALEATQFGIPAVISKQSGVAEVLDSALKADFWDIDLLADHIVRLVNDKELREKLVKQGIEEMKTLSWDDAVDKILTIFTKHLS